MYGYGGDSGVNVPGWMADALGEDVAPQDPTFAYAPENITQADMSDQLPWEDQFASPTDEFDIETTSLPDSSEMSGPTVQGFPSLGYEVQIDEPGLVVQSAGITDSITQAGLDKAFPTVAVLSLAGAALLGLLAGSRAS